ncbi:putative membrane protein [Chlamydia psittaci 08-2626_L3]|nr:putative membrane protein [Chlamydia psittaci 08-2626_L3]
MVTLFCLLCFPCLFCFPRCFSVVRLLLCFFLSLCLFCWFFVLAVPFFALASSSLRESILFLFGGWFLALL